MIVKPLQRFAQVNMNVLKDLDEQQKEKVLGVLKETKEELIDWIKIIRS